MHHRNPSIFHPLLPFGETVQVMSLMLIKCQYICVLYGNFIDIFLGYFDQKRILLITNDYFIVAKFHFSGKKNRFSILKITCIVKLIQISIQKIRFYLSNTFFLVQKIQYVLFRNQHFGQKTPCFIQTSTDSYHQFYGFQTICSCYYVYPPFSGDQFAQSLLIYALLVGCERNRVKGLGIGSGLSPPEM